MKLVLASESLYRRQILKNLHLEFIAERPDVDEEELKSRGPKDLTELTRFIALKKAESLKNKHPQSLILGGDQIAELQGERLDKPGTLENAEKQLARLSGKTHRLITSLAVVSPLKTVIKTTVAEVTFRNLSEPERKAYVRLEGALDCAGAYKIEKAGLVLIDKVVTKDPSSIQGLSVMDLRDAVFELGLNWLELWSPE